MAFDSLRWIAWRDRCPSWLYFTINNQLLQLHRMWDYGGFVCKLNRWCLGSFHSGSYFGPYSIEFVIWVPLHCHKLLIIKHQNIYICLLMFYFYNCECINLQMFSCLLVFELLPLLFEHQHHVIGEQCCRPIIGQNLNKKPRNLETWWHILSKKNLK